MWYVWIIPFLGKYWDMTTGCGFKMGVSRNVNQKKTQASLLLSWLQHDNWNKTVPKTSCCLQWGHGIFIHNFEVVYTASILGSTPKKVEFRLSWSYNFCIWITCCVWILTRVVYNYSLLPSVFTNVGRGVLDPRNTPTVGAPFELKLLKPHRFSVSEGILAWCLKKGVVSLRNNSSLANTTNISKSWRFDFHWLSKFWDFDGFLHIWVTKPFYEIFDRY